MNALAAVMDDLNHLCQHGHEYLTGLDPPDALEAMGVPDGGVLVIAGAASGSQFSLVLRKAQEARASGVGWWREGCAWSAYTPLRLPCHTAGVRGVLGDAQWQHTPVAAHTKVEEGVIVGCSVRQTREATTANKLPRMRTS